MKNEIPSTMAQDVSLQLTDSLRMRGDFCGAHLSQIDASLERVLRALRICRDADPRAVVAGGVSATHSPVALPSAMDCDGLRPLEPSLRKAALEEPKKEKSDHGDHEAHDESCLRILQHTLALCELCPDDMNECPTHCAAGGPRLHPAAFLLEGADGPLVRLLSVQLATATARRGLEELQGLAADIIAATWAVLCTHIGRASFRSPFGGPSEHHAATYTELLYLRFLQEVHEDVPSQSLMRRLLRALRQLCVGEKWAHHRAVSLSAPNLLSRILDISGAAPIGIPRMGVVAHSGDPGHEVIKNENKDNNLDKAIGRYGEMADALGSIDNGAVADANHDSRGHSGPAVPHVPALNLCPLALPLCDTSNSATSACAPPTVPPLTLPAVSQRTSPVLRVLEPATVAELLLWLCVLLPGRAGGMVRQSILSAPSLLCALQCVKDLTWSAACADAVAVFDTLVTQAQAQAQRQCHVWSGVDVLRRLLVPQPRLLDGVALAQRIGAGGYGSVFAAALAHSGGAVAVKLFPVARKGFDGCGALLSCHTEVTALIRLQGHLRICEFLFAGRTASHYVIAMPLYNGGSLRKWRMERSGFPTVNPVRHLTNPNNNNNNNNRNKGSIRNGVHSGSDTNAAGRRILSVCGPIFAQLLEAVEFMHSHNIRHNDLKADNILIESFCTESLRIAGADETVEIVIPVAVRLCDFGVCEVVGVDTGAVEQSAGVGPSTTCWVPVRGTESVQAPEALALRNVTPNCYVARESSRHSLVATELAADMWACGCLLYELLTGTMLFGGEHLGRLLALAAETSQCDGRKEREVLRSEQREALDACGDGIAAFALQLLALKPLERLSASAAREEWQRLIYTNV